MCSTLFSPVGITWKISSATVFLEMQNMYARTWSFKYWRSQIKTSNTLLRTSRIQRRLLSVCGVRGKCLGKVTCPYIFATTTTSKVSGVSPVMWQNITGLSCKTCHTSLPLALLPWKLGNKVLIRGVFQLRTTGKDRAERRTKALRLKTKSVGGWRTQEVLSKI